MYLLGYIPKDNRLYLGDKELNVVSYSLLLSVLEYQTAVMRRDFETADKVCSILCVFTYSDFEGGKLCDISVFFTFVNFLHKTILKL